MTRLRTILAVAILAAAAPAIAGEVTGTGEDTPINGFIASSICSFSGQNDGNPPPGRVQSFGQIRRAFGVDVPTLFGPGGDLHPGVACVGT
jgi:hypothetical protein